MRLLLLLRRMVGVKGEGGVGIFLCLCIGLKVQCLWDYTFVAAEMVYNRCTHSRKKSCCLCVRVTDTHYILAGLEARCPNRFAQHVYTCSVVTHSGLATLTRVSSSSSQSNTQAQTPCHPHVVPCNEQRASSSANEYDYSVQLAMNQHAYMCTLKTRVQHLLLQDWA